MKGLSYLSLAASAIGGLRFRAMTSSPLMVRTTRCPTYSTISPHRVAAGSALVGIGAGCITSSRSRARGSSDELRPTDRTNGPCSDFRRVGCASMRPSQANHSNRPSARHKPCWAQPGCHSAFFQSGSRFSNRRQTQVQDSARRRGFY